jgi:hypothetical protein
MCHARKAQTRIACPGVQGGQTVHRLSALLIYDEKKNSKFEPLLTIFVLLVAFQYRKEDKNLYPLISVLCPTLDKTNRIFFVKEGKMATVRGRT